MSRNPYSNKMWVTTTTEMDVTKIFRRQAKVKNREIKIFNFFPNHLWKEKMMIEKIMSAERKKQPSLKYQLRLGKTNIKLMIKEQKSPVWIRVDPAEYDDNFYPTDPNPNTSTKVNEVQSKRKDISPIARHIKRVRKEDDSDDSEIDEPSNDNKEIPTARMEKENENNAMDVTESAQQTVIKLD